MSETHDWTALETRVASASMPGYRRAWFVSLIRQGREAEAANRSALAAHCFVRTEKELQAFPAGAASASPASAAAESAASPSRSSPLADLAARRGTATRNRYLELLQRHEGRLSPAERESYRAALDGDARGDAAQASAPVSELRRRLVDRLLRSARYQRQGSRLASWGARKPASTPDARPSGPYNDYQAVEQLMQRLALAQPEWTAEFLDVYSGMREVRLAYGALLPGK